MIDKLYHFLASFVIALYDPVLAVLAGIGKELWDVLRGSFADVGDLFADALGILFALTL